MRDLTEPARLDAQLIRGRIAAGKRDYVGGEGMLKGIVSSDVAPAALKWEAQARLAKMLDDAGNPAEAEGQYQSCDSADRISTIRARTRGAAIQFSDEQHRVLR